MPDSTKINPSVLPVRARNFSTIVLAVIWLALALGGTWILMAYANTPSAPGKPPAIWPKSSALQPPTNGQPALVMFVHPHCPCSRATIGELGLLMAHCQGRVRADVYFLRPAAMSEEWVNTDLWRDASHIPGVTVHRDDDGREAHIFGSETSGDTRLYSPAGELLFHGGITSARGHSGDNAGRDAIEALLSGQLISQKQIQTRVFGCSLFECSATTNQ
jgi:hypothetical protein